MLSPFPMQALSRGAVVSKKLAAKSTAQFDARTAVQLEHRSRSIGAPVDDAAIDRILATIDLTGTTAILIYVPEKLDAATAAAVKRMRWGGEMRWMLNFLKARVRQRKLSTPQARKKIKNLVKALSEAKTMLRTDRPVMRQRLRLKWRFTVCRKT